jgi:hypothetical protein
MLLVIGCIPTFAGRSTPTAEFTPTTAPTPSEAVTPTPERLKLIDGYLDPCLLVSTTKVEAMSGLKIAIKKGFSDGEPYCNYYSITDGRAVFQIFVTTETSMKKSNRTYPITDWFDAMKTIQLRMEKEVSSFDVEDIPNLGEKAFSTEGSNLGLYVLNNGIMYLFDTRSIENGGVGYENLLKLAKMAYQRMP